MNKHLALAYGFAGLAVAAALIAFVTTSTTTLGAAETNAAVAELAAPDSTALDTPIQEAPATVGALATAPEAAVEYVYVDEPARRTGRHDDEEHHEHDDDDRDERGGHHDRDD